MIQIEFGPQIIKSYKRLSYSEWYALAEFIDNSTEAYERNRATLDPIIANLEVRISYNQNDNKLVIRDNSIGMSEEELRQALRVGWAPAYAGGRSRYGLGMKTAACWLGDYWSVTTKKLGDSVLNRITVDVDAIADDETDLHYGATPDQPLEEHYTEIEITKLNRKFGGRTIQKVKDYLRSMYRRDFDNYGLKLYWQGELLTWDYEGMIYSRLHKDGDGNLMIKPFEFQVGKKEEPKKVSGWVGVFEKGARKDSGFSLLQTERVIKGWPDAYKPELIFGESRNDLVNQRLLGEVQMDDFAVSHTKDEILFVDNDEEEFEFKLAKECEEYCKFANDYRKFVDDDRLPTQDQQQKALASVGKEIESEKFRGRLFGNGIPSDSTIRESWRSLIDAVIGRREANLAVKLNDLAVSVYVDPDLSADDPYVLLEHANKDRIIVILNGAHPHWAYLSSYSDVENFIRHCTYDGAAEWKAKYIIGQFSEETIRYIKDDLLRVPYEIEAEEN